MMTKLTRQEKANITNKGLTEKSPAKGLEEMVLKSMAGGGPPCLRPCNHPPT